MKYRISAKKELWYHIDLEADDEDDAIDRATGQAAPDDEGSFWVADELLDEFEVAPDGIEDVEEVE